MAPPRQSKTSSRARAQEPAPTGGFYPFFETLPTFTDRNFEKRYARYDTCEILSPMYAEKSILVKMNVWDEVKQRLEASNLGFLVNGEYVYTYEKVLKEFMCSLSMDIDPVIVHDNACRSWTFQMGGFMRTLSADQIRGLFNAEKGEIVRLCPVRRNLFWRILVGRENAYFLAKAPASQIEQPVWRIIHRLLANHFNIRSEKGGYLIAADLDLLYAVYHGVKVDIVTAYSDTFKEYIRPKWKGLVLGGGTVATLIAQSLGYDLSRAPRAEKYLEVLNRTTLAAFSIIDHHADRWANMIPPPDWYLKKELKHHLTLPEDQRAPSAPSGPVRRTGRSSRQRTAPRQASPHPVADSQPDMDFSQLQSDEFEYDQQQPGQSSTEYRTSFEELRRHIDIRFDTWETQRQERNAFQDELALTRHNAILSRIEGVERRVGSLEQQFSDAFEDLGVSGHLRHRKRRADSGEGTQPGNTPP